MVEIGILSRVGESSGAEGSVVGLEAVDWGLLAVCVGGSSVAGVGIYHAVAGFYHYRYYVRRRMEPDSWKLQPARFLSPELHRLSIRTGTANMVLTGALSGVLTYGVFGGNLNTPIYTDVGEYGWVYTLGMTVVLFVTMDFIVYWLHRTLHTKFLFKRVHRFHHRFVATSPYVAVALHPAELLILQAGTLAPLLFVPFHAASAAVVLLYILVFNIVDHSGVKLVSAIPWQPPSVFHDDHHTHVHVNFGQHLTLWDRLHGTLRRHGRRYGEEVFGGRGVRDSSDDDQRRDLEPFIRY